MNRKVLERAGPLGRGWLRQREAQTTRGGKHACNRHHGARRPGSPGSPRSSRSPRWPRPGARADICRGGEPHGHHGTERLTGRAAEGGPPPYVPGMDAAGIVDEVGEGVATGVKVGDAVMAMVVPKGSHGAYRSQIVLAARAVVPAPAGSTHVEACTLPMNGLTARQSLDLLGLSAGQTLAVTGAAGAYGGYVVQLAKAEGLTVIADASEADHALVASLGADIVVRRGNDVATRI